MAAAYTSRDIVEDYLCYKLLNKGVAWRFPPPPPRRLGNHRGHDEASSSASSWRSGRARTSHRGAAPDDAQQDPRSAPPRLQVTLRCTGDKLERHYHGNLSAHVSLLLCEDGAGDPSCSSLRQSLTAVREELFRDGVNWGRIVAMMELGGALSAEVARTGGHWQVDHIARWMEESLDSLPVRGWIEDNGGWDAFVELYGECRPSASFWSLRTVVGLAVLGAAGITLGVLFSWK